MKIHSAIFFQTIIVLIGIGALIFLLWEPHVEGVNTNATSIYQIYFDDPFLAYAYIASISFFMILYHAFKILGYVRQNKIFSLVVINSLQIIKYCAISMIGFVLLGEIFILMGESDDRPPAIVMGAVIILGSVVTAIAAEMFKKILQNIAVDSKLQQ